MNQDLLAVGHYYGSAVGRARLRAALANVGLTCVTGGEGDPVRRHDGVRASIDHVCLAGTWAAESGGAHDVVVWPEAPLPASRLSDHYGVAVTFA